MGAIHRAHNGDGERKGRDTSQRFLHPLGESRPYRATATFVGAQFTSERFLYPVGIAPEPPSDTSAFNPDIHHRRSIRLRGYDYSQAGAYFITLCTQQRECLFGMVDGEVVRLNESGRLVQDAWNALPTHYSCVDLDSFVVMPNHIHGIVILNDVGARFIAPITNPAEGNQGAMNRAPTVGEIVRAFKARCTHGINQLRGTQGVSIWQRNYYEHIIRNETSLQEIREYINNNPAQWANDRENPDAVGSRSISHTQIRKDIDA